MMVPFLNAPVAPFAGAWIEIGDDEDKNSKSLSLRSPERGLKLILLGKMEGCLQVAPFAGAWIEILLHPGTDRTKIVAPFAGAWIEIVRVIPSSPSPTSLRSPERGLKSRFRGQYNGVWLSLRSPERGLKLHTSYSVSIDSLSLRSPERGLKS